MCVASFVCRETEEQRKKRLEEEAEERARAAEEADLKVNTQNPPKEKRVHNATFPTLSLKDVFHALKPHQTTACMVAK